ncbi:hypothetical protein MMC07_007877 [Pseudocyphellaria aurata]|nr:hypothetical protein [Pseudocyphellaria aurata]
MAFPQPAVAIPREISAGIIKLKTKPSASIHYSFVQGNSNVQSDQLVIFLNGLIADKASWLAVMAGIIRTRKATTGFPSMLAYDRYGQGLTEDRDPQDRGREKGHGHDVEDAVTDLHQLVTQVVHERLRGSSEQLRICLVANSIGCAIARLYAQKYPGEVAALLLLDSIMANSNFDFWPDPDAEGFDANQLPDDVTVELLREQRARFAAMFSPNTANREGLSRRNLAELLPYSDSPKIIGPDGKGPWVTVVGHDFEHFASESLKVSAIPFQLSCHEVNCDHQSMETPISLSMQYTNPLWHTYNLGLVQITDENRRRGPVFAEGCGHFIQRDDPNFVAGELSMMLDRAVGDQL